MMETGIFDQAKHSTSELIEAYGARLAWLETERRGTTSKAALAELDKVEGAIGAASHGVKDLLDALNLGVKKYGEDMKAIWAQRAAIDPLQADISASQDAFALQIALMKLGLLETMDVNLRERELLFTLSVLPFILMCQSGIMVLRPDDEFDGSVFKRKAVEGFFDAAMSKVPFGEIGVIVMRAFQEATTAVATRRNHADQHFLGLENVQQSCFAWAAFVNQYVASLNAAPVEDAAKV